MRFGTWNIRSPYRVDAIKLVVGEFEKCKLDLVGVQEVRWEEKDIKQQTIIRFSMEKGMLITN
jgi:exonuclease III